MSDVPHASSSPNKDEGLSQEGSPLPADDNHLLTPVDKESVKITRKYVPVLTRPKKPCFTGRLRIVYLVFGCLLFVVSLILMVAGTIRVHQCNKEGEMAWSERFIEENVDHFVATNNFALEKPTKQSSDHVLGTRGYSELAVDGDSTTCSQTDEEIWPCWWVDLKSIRPIEAVIIKGSHDQGLRNISITIQNTEPNFSDSKTSNTDPCFNQKEKVSTSIVTTCGQNTDGRYVIIRRESDGQSPRSLVLCEVLVTQRI
ncbi:uncharacterized protein LOC133184718 [Saccostrea echinata]|uniref:uncharacterized protein LOC133184718 n=1 Tax=Saccostrea echinata TaxID=191078 RepID=UPI002A7ED3BB|nr:uncharacterized protein LOC133184718 [Saccostrea echinata]